MNKTPDVQLCPSCGCYQRRGMLCMKCSKAPFSVEITEPKTPLPPTDATIAIDIKASTDAQLQEAMETIHKEQLIRAFSMASMEPRKQLARALPISDGEAATLLEPRKQHFDGMLNENTRSPVEPIPPNPLSQDVIEVPIEIFQRWERQIDTLRAGVELHGLTLTVTIINQKDPWIVKAPSPAVASAFVEPLPLTEEAGYLEGMDRYLSPEWDIPTCPIIGKGPSDHCKHGMGNLDYCPHCEQENDDIDLSEEAI
ncbi:hypothetical protein [Aeromonas phage 59.1]|nr:hypothetical protein [Aeromonas phage 59.1]